MRIAFDVQSLLDDEKTGVGYCAEGFITQMITAHPECEFVLNGFAFRKVKNAVQKLQAYQKPNVTLNVVSFPKELYRLLSMFLPIPYHWFYKTTVDITHFFNFIVPPGVIGKRIVTIHDMSYRRYPETVREKTKWMLKIGLKKTINRADRIITDSLFSREEINCFFPNSKTYMVCCGIDKKRFNTRIPQTNVDNIKRKYSLSDEYVLYLGTLEPRKNIGRLLEAYSKIQNAPLLVIAGRNGWMYESVFEEVKALGIAGRVIFTGYIPEVDKPPLLAGAKCFLFPSLYEGFGLPPLEAMACGTPVIASNAASLPEVCGDAAVYVDPYDVAAIAQTIEIVVFDDSLRQEMSKRGMARAQKFDWEDLAEKLFEGYEEIV
ncbi:MAG: glycosyltransferase family 4 protein [Clostridiales bacterium]|jgi:glycosyltransferase involved in cell wall biosynthesis|nr:glycosyltransferase family 4 protein [Clostridiales bacterium]